MGLSSQIFAIQLLSYLCTQYALPKSLSVARLAISVMGTLLTGQSEKLLSASNEFMLLVGAPSFDPLSCDSQCSLYTLYQLLMKRHVLVFVSLYLAATIWSLGVSAAFSLPLLHKSTMCTRLLAAVFTVHTVVVRTVSVFCSF